MKKNDDEEVVVAGIGGAHFVSPVSDAHYLWATAISFLALSSVCVFVYRFLYLVVY